MSEEWSEKNNYDYAVRKKGPLDSNLIIKKKKKLIDTGLRYGLSMDMEIRFWTVSPTEAGFRILDVRGANSSSINLSQKYIHGTMFTRAVLRGILFMVFTIRAV